MALLTRGDERVSVAILTHLDGSHAYGEETLRGIAAGSCAGSARAEDGALAVRKRPVERDLARVRVEPVLVRLAVYGWVGKLTISAW